MLVVTEAQNIIEVEGVSRGDGWSLRFGVDSDQGNLWWFFSTPFGLQYKLSMFFVLNVGVPKEVVQEWLELCSLLKTFHPKVTEEELQKTKTLLRNILRAMEE